MAGTTTTTRTDLPVYTPKDFATAADVRWCPGCGDYAILNQVRKVLPTLGVPRENIVFVSGIGCSSRFPYYVETYGLHGIHGRAPAIATGVKTANPDLQVWVVTGDGDGLSIGGNHLLHALRRNVDIKILLFNNRIYGLTKGQYSPTSELGKKTKSSPFGSVDYPVNPISFALGAEATFVARTVDVDLPHLAAILKRAAEHRGSAFVEIYQDCNVFNHKAFEYAESKQLRPDHTVYLEHGKPLIFGKQRDRGIRLNGYTPEVVQLDGSVSPDDLLIHDERAESPALAMILAQMHHPHMPEPLGVFRAVQRPVFHDLVWDQIRAAREKLGPARLDALFNQGDIWEVK